MSTVEISLRDHVAVVTGGGNGIGEATCRRLAAAGAHVVVVDRDESAARRVGDAVRAAGGLASYAALDVSCPDEVRIEVDRISVEIGPPSILVNNAGAWNVGRLHELDDAVLTLDMDVCYYGTLHLTRAVLPHMQGRGGGRIVNVVSDAGRVGMERMSTYAAAKGAVITLTRSLAREVGRHQIRVNAVSPGATRTPGNADIRAGWDEVELARQHPLRRLGEPDDQADAILFLVSDLSGWITGQVLSVNGGYVTT